MNTLEFQHAIEFVTGYALGSLLIFVPYLCYSYGKQAGYDLAVKDYNRIVKGK